jgi:DNA-binding LytR/AlgR family response regulator
MLRIAIVDTEEMAKEIVFALRMAYLEDFVFHYYTKLSILNKEQQEQGFQVVFLHHKFDSSRVHSAFVEQQANRLVVFCGNGESASNELYTNVMHVNRSDMRQEIVRVVKFVNQILKNEQHYLFSYNHVSVALKIHEIYYIEKDNKNSIYHTKKGVFSERKSMKDVENYFTPYGFIRIHSTYLVNYMHIDRMETDVLYLHNEVLPIARARRNDVFMRMKELTSGK